MRSLALEGLSWLACDARRRRRASTLWRGGAVIWLAGLVLWPAGDHARPLPDEAPSAHHERLGAKLIEQFQCGTCHTIDGISGAQGRRAPTLVGFGQRSYIAGRLPQTPEVLARWIEQPSALVPDTTMPALGVTPAQARAIAAFMRHQP